MTTMATACWIRSEDDTYLRADQMTLIELRHWQGAEHEMRATLCNGKEVRILSGLWDASYDPAKAPEIWNVYDMLATASREHWLELADYKGWVREDQIVSFQIRQSVCVPEPTYVLLATLPSGKEVTLMQDTSPGGEKLDEQLDYLLLRRHGLQKTVWQPYHNGGEGALDRHEADYSSTSGFDFCAR